MSPCKASCLGMVAGSLGLALLVGCALPPAAPLDESNASTTYRTIYLTHFSTLQDPEPTRIRDVGLHEVYPVPLEQFWEACLDVVWQYDAVARLTENPRMVVFSHGMALPTGNGPSDQINAAYCNALIVVLADPRGESGTEVYVVWLPPGSLEPAGIEPLTQETLKNLPEEVKKHPHRVTATRVASQFLAHVSTQLYWRERWLQKVQASQSDRSSK